MLRNKKLWIGLAISGVLLTAALRRVDIYEVSNALRQADYRIVLPVLALLPIELWLRAVRRAELFEPDLGFAGRLLFGPMMVGYLANNVLPGRLGELIRAYALGEKVQVSKSSILATILVERLADALALLLFLVGTLAVFPLPEWLRRSVVVLAAALLATFTGLVLLRQQSGWFEWLIGNTLALIPRPLAYRMKEILQSFRAGLRMMRTRRQLGRFVGLTLVVWSIEASTIWLFSRGFGLGLGIEQVVFLMVLVSLGTMVPAAPGYVGTFQFFAVNALAVLGVAGSQAMGFAIALHATIYLIVTFMGLLSLWGQAISLRQLARIQQPLRPSQGVSDGSIEG